MSPRAPRRPRTGRENGLVGLWYRCEAHGLTQDPVLLAEHPYCPEDGCTLRLRVVHTVLDDERVTDWNAGPAPRPGRPRRETNPAAGETNRSVRETARVSRRGRARRRELLEAAAADVRARRRRGNSDGAAESARSPTAPPAPAGSGGGSPPEPSAPGPEEVHMPTPTPPAPTSEKRPATELILAHLRATQPRPATRRELVELIRREKPDASTSLADMSCLALRKRGLIERTPAGWLLTPAAAATSSQHGRGTPQERAGSQGTGRRTSRRSPPKGPARTAPAPSQRVQPEKATGASRTDDVVRVVDPGERWWRCEVCQRRRRGPFVSIEAEDLAVRVCAPCAAEGDREMRAAAAPLLARRRAS